VSKPTDFSNLFPAPGAVLEALQGVAPQLFKCPNGHGLPHEVAWGRCSPVMCVDRAELRPPPEDSPSYAEDTVRPLGVKRRKVADPVEAEAINAQAEEAAELIRRQAKRAAQEALMPPPPFPVMPSKPDRAAVELYLNELAVYGAWKRAFDLRFGTQADSKDAAQEFMDRAGYPRKKEAAASLRAPIIINLGGGKLPWQNGGRTHEAELAVGALGDGEEDGAAQEGEPDTSAVRARLPARGPAEPGDGDSDAGDGGGSAP